MLFWSLFLALAGAVLVHTGGAPIDVHKELQKYKNATPYMDIQYRIGVRTETKRVQFELFWKDAPMTTLNFVKLLSEPESKPAYLNCRFHRIIPTFMMQGGDFTMHDGRGGRSIYGPKFKDEAFIHKHEPGVLSMANHGPNTNGSQFFITFTKQPHLDGKHVVFGRVKDQDSWNTIKEIEGIEIRDQSVPVHPVEIVKCGVEDGKAGDEGLGEEEIAGEEAGRRVSEEDAAKADRPDYDREEESSLYGNIGSYEEDEGYNDSMFDLDSGAGGIL